MADPTPEIYFSYNKTTQLFYNYVMHFTIITATQQPENMSVKNDAMAVTNRINHTTPTQKLFCSCLSLGWVTTTDKLLGPK